MPKGSSDSPKLPPKSIERILPSSPSERIDLFQELSSHRENSIPGSPTKPPGEVHSDITGVIAGSTGDNTALISQIYSRFPDLILNSPTGSPREIQPESPGGGEHTVDALTPKKREGEDISKLNKPKRRTLDLSQSPLLSSLMDLNLTPEQFSPGQYELEPGDSPGAHQSSPEQDKNANIDTIDALRQKLLKEQQRQYTDNHTIEDTILPLATIAAEVEVLLSWNVEVHAAVQIAEWNNRYDDVLKPMTGTIYHDINVAQRTLMDYAYHLNECYELKSSIGGQLYELYSLTFPTVEDYDGLKSEIEETGGDSTLIAPLLEQVTHLQGYVKLQKFDQIKDSFIAELKSQIEGINASIGETEASWLQFTKYREALEKQKPLGYPFFKEKDMEQALATIELVEKGNYPGGDIVDTIRIVLQEHNKEHNIDVTDADHIANILGLHPLGDSIDWECLEGNLEDLGDQKDLQYFRGMKPEELQTALEDHRPIIAILSSQKAGALPYHYLERPVVLDRYKPGPTLEESYVVVVDLSREQGAFRISVPNFIKSWTNEAILPGDAVTAIQQSRPANQQQQETAS